MKIRRLKEKDREELLQYVSEEIEINFFFVGDVESFGMEGEMVSIYVAESEENWEWTFCIYAGRYGLLYSQKEDYDTASVLALIEDLSRQQKITCISGKLSLVERLAPFFPDLSVTSTYMCRCSRLNAGELPILPKEAQERPLEDGDIPGMIDLYMNLEEFRQQYEGRIEESIQIQKESFRAGNMAVGIYEDGKLVSVASTSAACKTGAMVVGVGTREGYRGKGYARRAVLSLCMQAFERGCGFLCLFYDNPTAGKIYHSLGFETVGKYAMLR